MLLNLSGEGKRVRVQVKGTPARDFTAWRTSEREQYVDLGGQDLRDGALVYAAPGGSATTFFAK